MGVLYSVIPVDGRVMDWIESQDIDHPPGEEGRLPTPAEIRRAVSDLEGIEVEELGPHPSGDWQIFLTSEDPDNGPWTLINATGYRSDDEPCEIGFEKGWPDFIVKVLHHLSCDTGPLFLLADTGERGVVVWPSRSLEETLASWEHT